MRSGRGSAETRSWPIAACRARPSLPRRCRAMPVGRPSSRRTNQGHDEQPFIRPPAEMVGMIRGERHPVPRSCRASIMPEVCDDRPSSRKTWQPAHDRVAAEGLLQKSNRHYPTEPCAAGPIGPSSDNSHRTATAVGAGPGLVFGGRGGSRAQTPMPAADAEQGWPSAPRRPPTNRTAGDRATGIEAGDPPPTGAGSNRFTRTSQDVRITAITRQRGPRWLTGHHGGGGDVPHHLPQPGSAMPVSSSVVWLRSGGSTAA